MNDIEKRLKALHDTPMLPQDHIDYLYKIQDIKPKVVYDIGACVLHWTNVAKNVWPDARFYVFEAMNEAEFLYKESENVDGYAISAFSDVAGKEIDFFQNSYHPGGNSYYRENPLFSDAANILYSDDHIVKKITETIDNVVVEGKFELPDLIKIDVQGCELDIMKGMPKCMDHASDLIVEMQHVQYNKGAPMMGTTMRYIMDCGFDLVGNRFSNTQPDAPDSEYHFRKVKTNND